MVTADPSTGPAAAEPPGGRPVGAEGWEHEWSARAADTVESTVASLHDRVIRPILLVARFVVFAAIIAVAAVVALLLVSIGLLRLLDVYAFPGRVWASYLLIGFVFSAAGLLVWSRRTARQQ